MEKMSKSGLAIELSRLKVFTDAHMKLEQHPTDPEIAADVLWSAYMRGDIEGKIIADLGAGTGILGIGALMLGAGKVEFVEKDLDAIRLLEENLRGFRDYEIKQADILDIEGRADTVLQNPPFGTREKNIDRIFLKKAFGMAGKVYSFHKTATKGYIISFAEKKGFSVEGVIDFRFPLKQSQPHHRRRIHRIEVSCIIFKKNQ